MPNFCERKKNSVFAIFLFSMQKKQFFLFARRHFLIRRTTLILTFIVSRLTCETLSTNLNKGSRIRLSAYKLRRNSEKDPSSSSTRFNLDFYKSNTRIILVLETLNYLNSCVANKEGKPSHDQLTNERSFESELYMPGGEERKRCEKKRRSLLRIARERKRMLKKRGKAIFVSLIKSFREKMILSWWD